jgi:hypothetical protein
VHFKFTEKKLVICYTWSILLYGAERWTLRKIDQKYLENFEMWCWKRMEKISRTDGVRNEEVLQRVKEERNILQTINIRKVNWIGHILRGNCLLKHVTEGDIEGRTQVTGRRRRRCKQILDDLKETRCYWKLKEKALDCILWRTHVGK